MDNPLGIDVNPYFSWMMKSDGHNVGQTAYKITVRNEKGVIVWDTGKVKTNQSNYINYEGAAFKSRTRYNWQLTVWDNKNNESENEASFETAFLSKNDWKAKWAQSTLPRKKSKPGFGNQPPATMFRKIGRASCRERV